MGRFVEGKDRRQGVLLPEYLDEYVSEENPVRVVDVFVDELDLKALGFAGVVPEATGRPAYHPGLLLKIYVYGYVNQIASSRRLEREAQRNVEMMRLAQRLAPDFKTIADFRRDNGPAIRAACRQFIALCRRLELFAHAVAAIDGSKFKAVNTRDKNFTRASIQRRMEQVEASIERYMSALETADRHEGELAQAKSVRLERDRMEAPIYRKDLLPVIFVTGETVGPRMAPLYAALDLNSPIRRLVTLDGVHPRIAWTGAPADTARYAVAWAGEWTTTYELFRDLGVAFLGALVFIYLLLVGWFRSFLVPLVIMTPIPLTLIGVLPAHALVGMFLSGTGMIGLIALAGILARNSILLIDLANARVEAGASLRDAVLEAGEVRARPILLTAATVILGDGVLLFDPLLEGLGLTLMSGALIATLLTLLLVPVLYHHLLSASARGTAWLQAIRANRRE